MLNRLIPIIRHMMKRILININAIMIGFGGTSDGMNSWLISNWHRLPARPGGHWQCFTLVIDVRKQIPFLKYIVSDCKTEFKIIHLWPRSGWQIRSRLQKCIEVDTSLGEQNPSLLQEVPEHSMVKLVWRRHDSAKAKLSWLYHFEYTREYMVDIVFLNQRTKPFQTLWKDLRITLSFNVNFAQVWCIRRSSADVIGYV